MCNALVKHRHSAYQTQSGRCYYCGLPMWETDIDAFARTNKIKRKQARSLKCTAEHLEARMDGGSDAARNIVAACFLCNLRRHRRKQAPSPIAYRELVQRQLRKGRWHCNTLVTRFSGRANAY